MKAVKVGWHPLSLISGGVVVVDGHDALAYSGMPALATIALAGWWMSPPLFRGRLLVLWVAVAGAAFSSFALVRNW